VGVERRAHLHIGKRACFTFSVFVPVLHRLALLGPLQALLTLPGLFVFPKGAYQWSSAVFFVAVLLVIKDDSPQEFL